VPHVEAPKARMQADPHELHFAKASRADRWPLQIQWKMRLRRLRCWHDLSQEDRFDLKSGLPSTRNARLESSAPHSAPKRDHRVARQENQRAIFIRRMAPL
jgi:hypothetical protein